MTTQTVEQEEVTRLTREVRELATTLDRQAARALVDVYYRWQDHRIALNHQAREAAQANEPTGLLEHFATQTEMLERQMVSVLKKWVGGYEVGRWSMAQTGIGPIIAAGLLAHIDIEKAKTAGAIWRFSGLDPTIVWEKGQRRPFNADLKVLCWKMGDSFVKNSGREGALYGHLYRQRKQYEVERDERGGNAEAAAETLATRNFTDKATKEIYQSGHLPPGRLDLRARRWAVKIFLSHWHEVAWRAHFHTDPPVPYVLAHLDHVDYIPVPPGE